MCLFWLKYSIELMSHYQILNIFLVFLKIEKFIIVSHFKIIVMYLRNTVLEKPLLISYFEWMTNFMLKTLQFSKQKHQTESLIDGQKSYWIIFEILSQF